MRTPSRIHTVIVFIVLAACPVASAAAIGTVTFEIVHRVGGAHDLSVASVVAAIALLANVAALGLAFARSDSDDRALDRATTTATRDHARAS
jgi:hypothetical protein